MRLAVVIDQPFWFDGAGYSTNAPFIEFVLSFKERAAELVLFVPVLRSTAERGAYRVDRDPGVRIVPLPFFRTATEMYRSAYRFVPEAGGIFRTELPSWDVAWLVGSHLPSLLFQRVAHRAGKRTFFYIRSNIVKELQAHRYSGIAALAASMIAWTTEQMLLRALRRGTPAFVIGNELLARYRRFSRRLFPVYPTLVTEQDIVQTKKYRGQTGLSLVAVGRLTPEKGLDVLIDAIHILKGEGRQVTCRVVGAGKEEQDLKRRVARLGLEKQVRFAGFLSPGKDLYDAYDAADIYILSSYTEGLPKTLYEAMARGLPIVSTDVGGISEIVVHGRNGLLVPAGDPAALAGAVQRLAGDPELSRSCSAANLKRVKEFTLQRQRDRMFSVIEQEAAGVQRGGA